MKTPQDAGSGSRHGEPLSAGDSPAADRNKEPILEQLRRVLPGTGTVLEIASGTGQHAVYFARALPELVWQPTEPDPDLCATIARRVRVSGLPNLRSPRAFDVLDAASPPFEAHAAVCINMIHIAPWAATEGLFRHAAQLLAAGAPLVLYGPYKIGGEHTAESNAAFDASLRSRDADWGVRDIEAVAALARRSGFELAERVAMPVNNFVVVFRRV
jgi:SAM-dependent methyltransferase